jgi:hypothetical protein
LLQAAAVAQRLVMVAAVLVVCYQVSQILVVVQVR